MYKEFYHFNENPFNITADPDFFFSSSRHSEAFAHLIYGIQQRKGIIVITGEIGTGKTTICRTLLNRISQKTKTALILNPNFSDSQLLQMILKDFGIVTNAKNKFDLIEALNQFLIEQTAQGNNVVLIIDEAQNLKVKQLEGIRLLSNLETEKQKLLQIILVGQPELDEKLQLSELRQLNQRIMVHYHILPLDRCELQAYINHRLKVAQSSSAEKLDISLEGTEQPTLKDSNENVHFTTEALDAIYEISGGIPRRINILCDRALLAGFIKETKKIDQEIINESSREVACV